MVSTSAALSALTVAVLATSTGVDAHGTLVKPGLKFTGSGYGGNFAALVPMTALKPQKGDIFTNYPDANKNAAAFDRAFKASQYKTLKDFLLKNQDLAKGRSNMPKTAACGFTDPTGGAVQALPAQLEWYGGQMNHPGPCEVWCDNEVVVPYNGNCQQKYPAGKFAYAKDKCVGKSRLTMYWMSTLLEWQVYIQCAKIGNGQRSMDDDDDEATTESYSTDMYNATLYDGQDEAEHENEEANFRTYADATDDADDDNDTTGNDADDEPSTPSLEELKAQAEAADAADAERAQEDINRYYEEKYN